MALTKAHTGFKYRQLFSENTIRKLWPVLRNLCQSVVSEHKTQKQAPTPAQTDSKQNEELDRLNKEIAELNLKNSDLLDKYKRALADGENLRTRSAKQISEAKIYAIQNFCKDLLDVADVLNKATESVPREEINDKNIHLKNLYEGLVMTKAQLQMVFKRHGLEAVDPSENEKFDPNFHEALYQKELEDKESGSIIAVSKVGYKLHNRVIRPALVGVAK
ncbi:GrpE [Popillia japonica]|uniref:GrpE protein homolog n=1 Tax=Popillia japonica TaxID=7064 RepID=A0AAW1ML61_POPJA